MAGRPKKHNVPITVYISSRSKHILDVLKSGEIATFTEEETRTIKDGFQVSEETARLLEHLQRDSKDRGDKKSKGWFIDQALEHYVSRGGESLFQRLEKERRETGKEKSKGEFVEDALKVRYGPFYELVKSSGSHS